MGRWVEFFFDKEKKEKRWFRWRVLKFIKLTWFNWAVKNFEWVQWGKNFEGKQFWKMLRKKINYTKIKIGWFELKFNWFFRWWNMGELLRAIKNGEIINYKIIIKLDWKWLRINRKLLYDFIYFRLKENLLKNIK